MFFSKSLIATATLCLSLSLQAHAHAAIAPALGVSGTPTRNDVQRPSTAKPCGNANLSAIDTSSAITAAANGSFAATITNFNAGTDGSRQVTAEIDPTGTGKSFVSAEVLQNGDKSPTNVGSQQLVVQIPAGTTCAGGASGDKCLVSFTTAGGFGNCVVVQTAATTGSTAANSTAAATGSTAANSTAAATDSVAATTAAETTAAAATSATTAATATGATGKHHHHHKGAASTAAAAAAGANNSTAAASCAGDAEVKQKKTTKRQIRAYGTRAARIARRAAERPAVEVFA